METRTYTVTAPDTRRARDAGIASARRDGLDPVTASAAVLVPPTFVSDGTFEVSVYGEVISESERRAMDGDR